MPEPTLIDYIESGSFYKNVVEDGTDLIIIINYSGTILYVNPSVKDTLKYDQQDLIGKVFTDYVLSEDKERINNQLENASSKAFDTSVEFRFLCKDNQYRYLEFNSINLKHKAGTEGLILDCRDITERKKAAEELIEAQKAKEQFLAKMSHEIRTPINGIAGMVNLLLNTNVSKDQEKFLNAINSSAENLKVIINDILDLSIIESGNLSFEKIGFSPSQQIKSVLEMFTFQANEKGLTLDFKVAENADSILIGDPVRFNQILINLVSNSIKFTNSGDIYIKAEAEKIEGSTIHLSVSVNDTGSGIPQDKLKRIFEAFRQADESITRKYGGTGLGLSICKQLVELQGGQITVKSKVNLGTEFKFTIPYQIGQDEDVEAEMNNASDLQQRKLADLKVLLVEDNDINRLYAKNILKRFECEVDEAENGLTAIEKIKKSYYDIVLMDVQMPVMDGFEATTTIRETLVDGQNDVPIVALTANALKGDDVRCLEVGMNGYLSKPFKPEELFAAIKKYARTTKEDIQETDAAQDEAAFKGKVVDLAYLASVSGGDKAFMREMIEVFLTAVPETIDSFKENVGKDWSAVSSTAHKIKPSITFMGIETLKEVVREIEINSKEEKELDKVHDLVDLFVLTGTRACNELKLLLEAEYA